MIQTKQDLNYYLEKDRVAYHKPEKLKIKDRIVWKFFPDNNYEFIKCLRKLEYHHNTGGELFRLYYERKLAKLGCKTGIDMSVNIAGYGLHIVHGKVVISSEASIGNDCKILSDVTIGIQGRYDIKGAPTIGDRVYIGSGARIIGNISVADDVVIGANAVVVKDITEPGITVAGNPAKKVSNNDSYHYLNRN